MRTNTLNIEDSNIFIIEKLQKNEPLSVLKDLTLMKLFGNYGKMLIILSW